MDARKLQLVRKIQELEKVLLGLRQQMKQATARGNAGLVCELGVKAQNLENTIRNLRSQL